MTHRVLVTGANGKTGRAVVAAVAKISATVRAFIRKAEQAEALKSLGAAEHAIGDMNAPETIAPAMNGCTAIVHIGPPMHADEKAMSAPQQSRATFFTGFPATLFKLFAPAIHSALEGRVAGYLSDSFYRDGERLSLGDAQVPTVPLAGVPEIVAVPSPLS